MWNPEYPSKSPGDDDLEVFFEDDDFRALLGNAGVGASAGRQ
jgi:hypothetical protein